MECLKCQVLGEEVGEYERVCRLELLMMGEEARYENLREMVSKKQTSYR